MDPEIEPEFQPRGTRSNTKITVYVPPRIDADAFQADIPQLQDSLPPPTYAETNWYEGTHCINRPDDVMVEEREEFLTFARNIYEQHLHANEESWTPTSISYPLETDERLLEFLETCAYDVEKAKLSLLSMLGGKKYISHIKRVKENLSKLTAQGILMERFQSVWTPPALMHGAYTSSEDTPRLYTMRMLRQEPPPAAPADEKRVRFDKAEIRKKWNVVAKRVQSIISHNATAKPSLREATDALQTVADLIHLPNDIYTGDGFFQELFASIDKLLVHVMEAREWVSKVYDELHADPMRQTKGPSPGGLRRLLTEGHHLFLRCDEEALLRRVVGEMELWLEAANDMLDQACIPNEKLSMVELNALLNGSKALLFTPPQVSSLRRLYNTTMAINDDANVFLDRAKFSATKKFKGKKFSLEFADDLLRRAEKNPVALLRLDELQALMKECHTWQDAVTVLCSENTAALKSVEVLLAQGELLPIDFPTEMELLREKRVQAKMWLDKLKKSFLSTNRNTRKNIMTGEKMSYNDMKAMVMEGEQLYDDGHKELDRAVDAIDSADEWAERVREMLRSATVEDIGELEDLLRETELMPVEMDEALVLRVHIEALEWSQRVKPLLDSSTTRLADLQKSQKEIVKIRNSLSKDVNPDFIIYLPEEEHISSVLSIADALLARVKTCFGSGSVPRKDTTLENLRSLLIEANGIPVNMDSELRHVRKAVYDAEEWMYSNAAYLKMMHIDVDNDFVCYAPMERDRNIADHTESVEPSESLESAEPTKVSDEASDMVLAASESSELETPDEVLNEIVLARIVQAASHIKVTFPQLSAIHMKHNAVSQWLAIVHEKCPKKARTKKNIKDRDGLPRLEELHELLQKGQTLGIVLIDEEERLTQAITSMQSWEVSCTSKFAIMCERLDDIVNSHTTLVHERSKLSYPFMLGVDASLDAIAELVKLSPRSTEKLKSIAICIPAAPNQTSLRYNEADVWAAVVNVAEETTKLRQEGREIGVLSTMLDLVHESVSVLKWVIAVNDLLKTEAWADIARDEIISYIQEATSVLDVPREKYDAKYDGTVLKDVYDAIADAVPTREPILEEPDDADASSSSSDEGEHSTVDDDATPTIDDSTQATPRSESQDTPMRTRRREHTSWKDRFADGNYDPTPSAVTADVKDPPKPKRKSSSNTRRKSSGPEEYNPALEAQQTQKRPTKKSVANRKRKSASASARQAKKLKTVEVVVEPEPSPAPLLPSRKRIIQNFEGVEIPEAVQRLLDFWVRQLCVLLRRVDEANIWSDCLLVEIGLSTGRSTVSKQWNSIVLKREKESTVMNYLSWAEQRNIKTHIRDILVERCERVSAWNRNAADILSRTNLLKFEELHDFIKSGEKLLFHSPDNSVLKEHYKKAKQWINRARETSSEDASTAAAAVELLAPEAENILVDLSEYVANMQQATTVYCVCRLPYHGLMLGCDTCEEWYHAPCFGITKSQAERSEKYSCIRCILKQTFAKATIVAGETINTWVDPDAAIEALEDRKSKLASIRIRDQSDWYISEHRYFEAHKEIEKLKEPVPNPPLITPPADDANRVAIEALMEKQAKLRDLMDSLKLRIEAYVAEENELARMINIDDAKKAYLLQWMVAVQGMLWPTTDEDVMIGEPVVRGLPHGVAKAIEAARACGLDALHCVKQVVESFQWMSWTYQAQCALREPPTTIQLRKLLEFKPKVVIEEKPMKILANILSRATTWKHKVRKLLRASLRHRINDGNHSLAALMDVSKATALYADSSSLPIKTRLREALKKVVASSGGGVPATTSRKKSEPAQTITCDAAMFADSSDEESNNASPSIPYVATCGPHLAPEPPKMWPPVLSMGPRAAVTTLKRRTTPQSTDLATSAGTTTVPVPSSSMDLHEAVDKNTTRVSCESKPETTVVHETPLNSTTTDSASVESPMEVEGATTGASMPSV